MSAFLDILAQANEIAAKAPSDPKPKCASQLQLLALHCSAGRSACMTPGSTAHANWFMALLQPCLCPYHGAHLTECMPCRYNNGDKDPYYFGDAQFDGLVFRGATYDEALVARELIEAGELTTQEAFDVMNAYKQHIIDKVPCNGKNVSQKHPIRGECSPCNVAGFAACIMPHI